MGAVAFADCLPDTSTNSTTTSCSGVTNGGLAVSLSSTTTITAGAVLTAGTGDEAAFFATLDPLHPYDASHVLNVEGQIDGSAAKGVILNSQLAAAGYGNPTLQITVGAAGEITGATAIEVRAPTPYAYSTSTVSLDNSGQIRSTTGPALIASDYAGFQIVTNRQGAFIGGINAAVGDLKNAGTIDGGSSSAYRSGPTNGRPYAGNLDNSGVMRSNGAAATLAFDATGGFIVNTGLIANTGSGAAIDAGYYLGLTNQAGGVISSAGPIAIQMASTQVITNRGLIIGSVVNTGASYYYNNQFDNLGGTIQGDLLLGPGDDILTTDVDLATGAILGVTGRIDGGGGTNTLVVDVSNDAVLDGVAGRLALPTNFQAFQVRLSADATATFETDSLNAVVFTGKGHVVSNADLTMPRQGLQLFTAFNTGAQIGFVNNGDVTFTYDPTYQPTYYRSSYDFALAVDGPTTFTNNGDILALNGGKGLMAYNTGVSAFVNNGVITADGVGVSSNGLFENNGVIRSATTGVSQGGSYGNGFLNTGSIAGVTAGVELGNGALTNSGTVTGVGAGVLMSSSSVENLAGGVISGTVAIKASSIWGGNNRVGNAGVINGDVDFTTGAFSTSRDVFTDNGGTVNGSVILGADDDVFVSDLNRYVDGRFTGVTGVVHAGAGQDRLVLRIGADTAAASIDLPTGFEGLGLVLQDNADTKVTVVPTLTSALNITGQGALDLTATITTNWSGLIALYGDYGQIANSEAALSIVSRGALTYTQAGAYPASGSTNAAIGLHSLATFENAGSLSVSGSGSAYTTVFAIQGGAAVINSGAITLSGVVGVNGATAFTNTGSLVQALDGASSVGVRNAATVINSGTIETGGYALHTNYEASAYGPRTVTNSGVIKSTGADAIQYSYGSPLSVINAAGGEITSTTGKAIASTAFATVTVHNEGVINGGVDVLYGDDRIENYGAINGNVSLGEGNDTFVQWVGGAMNGAVDGGNGLDALVLDSTGGGRISTSQFINFESFTQIGGGSLNYAGAFGEGPIVLDGGSAVVLAGDSVTTTGDVTFSGGAGSEHVTIEGSISGGVSLGDGVDSVVNRGAIGGAIQLGAGADSYTEGWGSTTVGEIDGGVDLDTYIVDLAGDRTGIHSRSGFETLGVTGAGALTLTLDQNWDSISLAGASLHLTAGAYTVGRLSGGATSETVWLDQGVAQIDLGGGDDVLRLTGGAFTGSADGGTGRDRLELAFGGTDAAPVALGAASFQGFEALNVLSGVISVAGDHGFDTIAVQNGRLIGLAGSRLTASTITVAGGATFGSAGAVNGDITVAGTLSPGASPGTMTVTGNVALAAGSTALFEITPTVSDQLVVSGTVTIAQGSTLKLVGAAALTPGRRLDLITAGGGITGAFSTINGAQGLNLHIAQSATRLQALGLFTTDTGFSSQVSGLISTLNTALIEDKVSAPLVAAFPALVDPATNKSDPRALARVTPQAYASATQLALEDGLTIIDASRAQARFAPEAPGLFGFGQAIASRRTLDGDAALGVAKGKINTDGGLAGVGYGVDSAWAGVFVGYLNGRQRIRDLDVRTETDSFAIGVQGQVRLGAFQLGAMAAHDGADVGTRRAAPGGTTATGDYKLKSWIADVNLTYRARLNADWTVRPRLGASYVRASRDGFVERGGGAFALTVEGDKASAWLVDGQVEVLGGQAAGERLHPYASLGFRSAASGGDTTASATLAGLSTPITVTGLDRSGTLATVGAGMAYDLAHGLTVSATYAGEFGDGGQQAILMGLNWKF